MPTNSELQTCRKVADYLKRTALPFLADMFADQTPELEAKRASKTSYFLEFYIVFYPSEVERINNKLEFGIRQFSKGEMSNEGLKKICDDFIKCHTVAWLDSVPNWKSKEVK
jgi:hypothetical protein